MARMHWVALIALGLGMSATGCVSADKFNALRLENEQNKQALASAQAESSGLKGENETLKQQNQALQASNPQSFGLIQNLQSQVAALTAQATEWQQKYEAALRNGGGAAIPLDPQTTSALQAFAAQNPDIIEFDKSRGIVKFKSDVAFNLGSADLTTKAREVIDRFATILAANNYELLIAGHTDSTRVSRAETIAAGNKDNWFLSAHRAIGVAEELQKQHIGANRIGVLGYADQKPVASNTTDAGREKNRRVEVLILPSTAASNVAQKPTGNTSGNRTKEFNKDGSAGSPDSNKPFIK